MRISDWSSDVCASDLYRWYVATRMSRPGTLLRTISDIRMVASTIRPMRPTIGKGFRPGIVGDRRRRRPWFGYSAEQCGRLDIWLHRHWQEQFALSTEARR